MFSNYRYVFLFIAYFPFQLTHADLVRLSQQASDDRIEQLTQTLALGSYAEAEDINLDKTDSDDVTKNNPILINPQDYKDLGIKHSDKVYADSDIWYFPESKKYAEQKYFPNNIRLFKLLNEDVAELNDMDDKSRTDSDQWLVVCWKDRITDTKNCVLGKYEMIFMRSSKTGWMFSVSKEIKELDRSEYQYIRIDKSPAWKSKNFFKGQPTLNIIEQMKNGNTAYTRFNEWSKQYEEVIPLKGFSNAYNTLKIMYSKL